MPEKKDTYFDEIKKIGVLTTIPIILLVGPAVGFFLGGWIDRKFHIYPWVTILFVGLGFLASGQEIARIIKDVVRSDESGQKTRK